jgi:hypothetical protein
LGCDAKDFGGRFGATFSKGPGYKFPTKTTAHSLASASPGGGGEKLAVAPAGSQVAVLRAVLPGMSAAEAEALVASHSTPVVVRAAADHSKL